MPLRMTDYRLRDQRKFPDKVMKQVGIYRRSKGSAEVFKNSFYSPGLWPYAVLGKTADREGILRQVSATIDELPRDQQSNLIAVTSIMAGLKLDGTVVQRLMRSDLMKESVIYQCWLSSEIQ